VKKLILSRPRVSGGVNFCGIPNQGEAVEYRYNKPKKKESKEAARGRPDAGSFTIFFK